MEITKGAIEFPFDFDYSLIPSTTYIALTKLKKHSIWDRISNKYIQEIKITHTGETDYDIKLTYEDNTNITVTKTFADLSTYLSGRITEIKTVGFIDTNANSYPLTTALINCVDDTVNCIFFYLLNSDKHTVDKDIVFVNCDYVEYNRFTSHKNIILNVKQSAFDDKYNYVFLTVLNRYYYVSDAVLQNDIFTLTLKEDVLMSFKDTILNQSAFITRNENQYQPYLVDSEINLPIDKEIIVESMDSDDIINSDVIHANMGVDPFNSNREEELNDDFGCFVITVVAKE